MASEAILTALHGMDERPWNDLRGKPVDNRWLSRQLVKYQVASVNVRTAEGIRKGYKAEDLHDPWTRYVAEVAGALWKLGDDDDEGSTTRAVGPPPKDALHPLQALLRSVSGAGPVSRWPRDRPHALPGRRAGHRRLPPPSAPRRHPVPALPRAARARLAARPGDGRRTGGRVRPAARAGPA